MKKTLSHIRSLNMSAYLVDGEYRISFRLDELMSEGLSLNEALERQEELAYYTTDLEDAWHTAIQMRKEKDETNRSNPRR